MNVVIIDSGLNELENDLFVDQIQGITIEKKGTTFVHSSDYRDNWGHGTIVANTLANHLASKINLFIINIFKDTLSINIDLLIEALTYCSTIRCDLIQISSGTLYSDRKLFQLVKELTDRGTIIVSAFDNDKSISYPAAYEEVIGVDVSSQHHSIEMYSINDNNVIDIMGADIYYRGIGSFHKKVIVRGSSFYSSYISAQIVNLNPLHTDKAYVVNELKKKAHVCYYPKYFNEKKIEIKNAIVFPFNKEIHSMAAFENLLNFSIDGFYDVRQRGNVSRRICDILPYTDNPKVVGDYSKLDWERPFDTVVCGHVYELTQVLKKDIMEEIIEKCILYNKQLVCFDNITKYNPERLSPMYWFPHMSKNIVPQLRYGKLRSPNIPIVGVFGTSSNQGKMTLQLYLRECFIKRGIKVKNIGSEPESALFGFEYSYVFGYHSTDDLDPEEMILTLNEAVYELEKDNCELIIVGSQSGTIANQLRNINMLPLKQYSFLLGTQPDSILLCINAYDSMEYIERTISFIESSINAKVICLIVSFVNSKRVGLKSHSLDYFMNNTKLPVFNLHNLRTDDLVDEIIKYYEESNEI